MVKLTDEQKAHIFADLILLLNGNHLPGTLGYHTCVQWAEYQVEQLNQLVQRATDKEPF